MPRARIISPPDFRAMPWKNGGGCTTEIHLHPQGAALDDFDWRASIADVATDGPFSCFAGVDRTLVLLDGNGVRLAGEGVDVTLREAFDRCEFRGELAIGGTLIDGPVRDFNLMVRRGRMRGGVTLVRGRPAPIAAAGFVLCYAAAGIHHCTLAGRAPIELAQGHALLVEADGEALAMVVQPASSAAVALVASVWSQ